VATLKGAKPGATVLLRGDMDALPMPRRPGSRSPRRSPADARLRARHAHRDAAGRGADAVRRQGELAGEVRFMFQPGEEGFHGARFMLEEGLLDPLPDAPSRCTSCPTRPHGVLACRAGPLLAAADKLEITVEGAAATPRCRTTRATRSRSRARSSRRSRRWSRAVRRGRGDRRHVTQIHAGTAHNIIPDRRSSTGTIRTLSPERRRDVRPALRELAEGIAAAHGCRAEVTITDGFPPTVNDPRAVDLAEAVARELPGGHFERLADPIMGAEDFSYVLEKVPGRWPSSASPPRQRLGELLRHPFEPDDGRRDGVSRAARRSSPAARCGFSSRAGDSDPPPASACGASAFFDIEAGGARSRSPGHGSRRLPIGGYVNALRVDRPVPASPRCRCCWPLAPSPPPRILPQPLRGGARRPDAAGRRSAGLFRRPPPPHELLARRRGGQDRDHTRRRLRLRQGRGGALPRPPGARRAPLDFLAVTDHAEYLGNVRLAMSGQIELPGDQAEWQRLFAHHGGATMFELFGKAVSGLFGEDKPGSATRRWSTATGRRRSPPAERANQPGRFTAFVAFEYSPTLRATTARTCTAT
jgi:hippurate hydrolase